MSATTSSASPVTSAAREPLATSRDTVVSCTECRVDFDDFADASEAQRFAGVHNDLHGHGRVTGAEVVSVDEDGW